MKWLPKALVIVCVWYLILFVHGLLSVVSVAQRIV